jgi:hypothetical protein
LDEQMHRKQRDETHTFELSTVLVESPNIIRASREGSPRLLESNVQINSNNVIYADVRRGPTTLGINATVHPFDAAIGASCRSDSLCKILSAKSEEHRTQILTRSTRRTATRRRLDTDQAINDVRDNVAVIGTAIGLRISARWIIIASSSL